MKHGQCLNWICVRQLDDQNRNGKLDYETQRTHIKDTNDATKDAQEIVSHLGHLPLAIAQAGAYIGSRITPLPRVPQSLPKDDSLGTPTDTGDLGICAQRLYDLGNDDGTLLKGQK